MITWTTERMLGKLTPEQAEWMVAMYTLNRFKQIWDTKIVEESQEGRVWIEALAAIADMPLPFEFKPLALKE